MTGPHMIFAFFMPILIGKMEHYLVVLERYVAYFSIYAIFGPFR